MTQLILGILMQKFHYSDVQNRKVHKTRQGYISPPQAQLYKLRA